MRTCISIVGVIMVFFTTNITAQHDSTLIDRNQFERSVKEVLPLLKLDQIKSKSPDLNTQYLRSLSPALFDVRPTVLAVNDVQLTVDNTYNDGWFFAGQEGLLGRYSLSGKCTIAGMLPVNASFTLANYTIEDDTTIHSYWRPFVNISLDNRALKSLLTQKSSLQKFKNFKGFDAEQPTEVWKGLQYQSLKEMVNTPNYSLLMDSLWQLNDSLELLLESQQDSALLAHQQEVCAMLEAIETLYSYYGTLKKSYNNWHGAWAQRSDSLMQVIKQDKAPALDGISGKLLEHTQKLKIGLSSLDGLGSGQRNMPFNGLQWGYQDKRFWFDVAAGSQLFRRNEMLGFSQLFNEDRRTSGTLSGNLGLKYASNAEVVLGYAQFSKPAESGWFPRFVPDNTVLTIKAKQDFKSNIGFEGDVMKSNLTDTYTPQTIPTELPDMERYKLAGSFQAKAKLSKVLQLSSKLMYVGPLFYSLGNPYQMTNRLTWSNKCKVSFLKGRLSAEVEYRNIRPVSEIQVNPLSRGNQMFGSAVWQLKKPGNQIMVQYAPTILTSDGTFQGQTIEQYIWLGQAVIQRKYKQREFGAITSITNARTQLTFLDTTLVDGLWYAMQNFSYTDKKKNQLSAVMSSGFGTSSGSFEPQNIYGQIRYQRQMGRISPIIGIEARKLTFAPDWFVNVQGGAEWKGEGRLTGRLLLQAGNGIGAPTAARSNMAVFGKMQLQYRILR